jgi:alkylhydroperoxidase family enzyme
MTPRVPLVPVEPEDPVVANVFAVFAREGREPVTLYRALACSPRMLRAYSGLAQGLRYEATTPRALRELVILRTAQLVRSRYEWAHHVPMALAAGVSERQLDELERWQESDAFDERERAALQLAEESHALAVDDETLAELRRVLDDAETIEIVLLAAFYEAVARLIQSLGLAVEDDHRQYLPDWR